MKVRFTNPNHKKFGSEEHVDNNTGRTLIALGEAEAVPMPKRGTNEFLAEMKERSARAIPNSADVVVPFITEPKWQIVASDGTAFSCVKIRKFIGHGSTTFSVPPPDAPPDIVREYARLCELPAMKRQQAVLAAEEKARIEAYQQKEKTFKRW